MASNFGCGGEHQRTQWGSAIWLHGLFGAETIPHQSHPQERELFSTPSHFLPLRTYPTPKALPVKRNLKNFVANLRRLGPPQGVVDFKSGQLNKKRLPGRFAGWSSPGRNGCYLPETQAVRAWL
jgi:hypothetical protein